MSFEIMKQTDEIRVETEQDAKSLIESFKQKADEGGYEIASYAATHKEKKSKGEIIDSYYVVKIVKKW